jgi:hypothetical protein
MIQRSSKRLSLRALIIDDELPMLTAEGRARALVPGVKARHLVVEAESAEDGISVVMSDLVFTPSSSTGRSDATRSRTRKALLEFVRSATTRFPSPYGRATRRRRSRSTSCRW